MSRRCFAACVLISSGLLAAVGSRNEGGGRAELALNDGSRPTNCPAAGWGFMCTFCGGGGGGMTAQQMWTTLRHFDHMKLVWIRQPQRGDAFCRVLACPRDWEHRAKVWHEGYGSIKKNMPACQPEDVDAASDQVISLTGQTFYNEAVETPEKVANICVDKIDEELRSNDGLVSENTSSRSDSWYFFYPSSQKTKPVIQSVNTPVISNFMTIGAFLDYDFTSIQKVLQQELLVELKRQREEEDLREKQRLERLRQLELRTVKQYVRAFEGQLNDLINMKEEMRRLRDEVALDEVGGTGDRRLCRAQPAVEDPRQLKQELKERSDQHKSEEKEQLTGMAMQMIAVSMCAISIAADAGVPGVGSALNFARVGMNSGAALATTLATTLAEHGSELNSVATTLGQVASEIKVPFSAMMEEKLSELSAGTGLGAVGLDAVKESILEDVKETLGAEVAALKASMTWSGLVAASKRLLSAAVEGTKRAMVKAVTVAINEVGWSGLELLPLVGPFVGLARGTLALVHMRHEAAESRRGYFQIKDPTLRSLIRLRDCFLEAFLETDDAFTALGMATRMDDAKAQVEALLASWEQARTAMQLNEDLHTQMHKKSKISQSAEDHEKSVMKRLQGRLDFWSNSIIPVNATKGDSYLIMKPGKAGKLIAVELRPSEWKQKFGELLQRTKGIYDSL